MSLPEKDAQAVENKTSNPSEVCILRAWHRGLFTDIVPIERRQRSSDSLEQEQRQPKQPKIDIEHLRQRFKKLKTWTTETTPRGIAVENTLPRFRPERVYYSGCRPFLEG